MLVFGSSSQNTMNWGKLLLSIFGVSHPSLLLPLTVHQFFFLLPLTHSAFPPSLPLFFWFLVPGAPPRKLEVEAINSTAIRVTWKPPLPGKQHGQIRGYQVIFSRLENGEPRGQPNIMDVALPEAQVLGDVLLLSSLTLSLFHCLKPSYVHFPLFSFYTAPLFTLHFPHTGWHTWNFSFCWLQ